MSVRRLLCRWFGHAPSASGRYCLRCFATLVSDAVLATPSGLEITSDVDLRVALRQEEWNAETVVDTRYLDRRLAKSAWATYVRDRRVVMRRGGWSFRLLGRIFRVGGRVVASCPAPPPGELVTIRAQLSDRFVSLGWEPGDHALEDS